MKKKERKKDSCNSMWCRVMSCFVDSAGRNRRTAGPAVLLLYWLFSLVFVSQGSAQVSGQHRGSFPSFTSYDSFFSTYNFFHIFSMQFGVLRLVFVFVLFWGFFCSHGGSKLFESWRESWSCSWKFGGYFWSSLEISFLPPATLLSSSLHI